MAITPNKKTSGGSALKRLRSSLNAAGILGQQSKASRSKKDRKKGRPSEVGKNDHGAKLKLIRDEFNPYEIKTTHTKFDIIGRKVKGIGGKPSMSKQIGEENRKKTLLVEMRNKNRSGGIIDKRFGENNPNLSLEEKMQERFTRERQRSARSTTSLFNLDDEDDFNLTHYGQSLGDMDDFDDTGLALSDDEDGGQLDKTIVDKMHFGGFGDEEQPEDSDRPKTKNEIMKELIAKSKMHKYERQLAKQEDDELREQLDDELGDLHALLKRKPLPSQSSMFARAEAEKADGDEEPLVQKKDDDYEDYDKALRDLATDRRARAGDRTKTEEELAMDEKEKLEKAERARKRRMEGLDSESEDDDAKPYKRKKKTKGPEADDLEDDDYFDEMETQQQLGGGLTLEDIQNGAYDYDNDMAGSDDEGSASDGEDIGSDDGDDDDDEEELEDDLVGPQFDAMDDDDDDMNEFGAQGKIKAVKSSKKVAEIASTTSAEIPFTFDCPESHDQFLGYLKGLSTEDVLVVIKRIRVLYHIKLHPENKKKMATFLSVLLDHLAYVASTVSPLPTKVLEAISMHIYEISQLVPEPAAATFQAKVKQMHTDMLQKMRHDTSSSLPNVEDIVVLRSLGQVFSTSDLTHQVATPAALLMTQALAQSNLRTQVDLGRGLFVSQLFLEYQRVSHRFIPEVLNFLNRCFVMLSPANLFNVASLPGSFPIPQGSKSVDLHLDGTSGSDPIPSLNLDALVLEDQESSDEMGMTLLQAALRLFEQYLQLYASTSALVEVFEPSLQLLNKMLTVSWHDDLQTLMTSVHDRIKRQIKFSRDKRVKTPLRMQAHRPIPIAQHMPKFEMGYSMDRHYDPDHERNAQQKLRAQYKKETKAAARELRKDNMFMAREKAKVKKQKDEDYNKMIKGVMNILEGDQAEKNRMDREKKKLR
ncbi:Nop14-like protein [Hesseltinella vesiculosa]|uniref:Nop14-like protein n=1 Tax=Hesseltinella vesiculosa TaxID=101127 RepID=A0A1X2G5R6_9FUNG|nr:Nop14-like protein [Hesseltinella vesiculosa]